MRVALYGGSFDPPHRGHVALARLAMERLRLDRVVVAPVGAQPLKQGTVPTSFEDRMAMVRLAFAVVEDGRIEVSEVDAPRADGRPNYTVDTIRTLQRTMGVEDRLFCLMGADSFLTIGKWYCAAELLTSCDFIVGARPGFDLGRLAAALPGDISVAAEEGTLPGCLVLGLRGEGDGRARLYLLPDLDEDVSATEIRAALGAEAGAEATVRRVLDDRVVRYIRENGLYAEM